MKIKQMTSYLLKNNLKITALFYGAVVGLFILTAIISLSTNSRGSMGLGNSSMIFLFVMGIVSFYLYLKVGFSYSISRKTVLASLLLGGFVFALIVGVADTLLAGVIPLLMPNSVEVFFSSYATFLENTHGAIALLTTFAYYLATSMTALALGYFIGGLYYRMSKSLKIIVSVGVPLLFFAVLPTVLVYLSNQFPAVSEFISGLFSNIIQPLLGAGHSPLYQIALNLAVTIVLVLFVWLLIRRAPVKDK